MNINIYVIKLFFAIIVACLYLTLSLLSSLIINRIMKYYKSIFNKNNSNIQLIIRVYLRTALIIIFLYIIRSGIKYLSEITLYDFDLNNSKQIERNAVIFSYGLFLLQSEYNEDIKNLFSNLINI